MAKFPTFRDEVLSSRAVKDFTHLTNQIRTSEAFVLDKEASRFFAELLRSSAEEIMRQHNWCRFPYENCWIEFDGEAYAKSYGEDFLFPNRHVGFHIYNGQGASVIMGHSDGTCYVLPCRILIHEKSSEDHVKMLAEIFGLSRMGARYEILRYENFPDDLRRDLVSSHMILPEDHVVSADLETRREVLAGFSGALVHILALGLLLTRPSKPVFDFHPAPRSSGIRRGKRRTFMAHTKCRIHLSRDEAFNRALSISSGERASARAHQVRGHWCQSHRKGDPGCDHEWAELEEGRLYRCQQCGKTRWWKVAHMRGDAGVGYVDKGYEVTR